jgi:hypothetical protein
VFCTRCGATLADDAAFCQRCGTPTAVAAAASSSPAASAPQPPVTYQETPPAPYSGAPSPAPASSQQRTLILLAIVGAAAIAAVLFFVLRKDDDASAITLDPNNAAALAAAAIIGVDDLPGGGWETIGVDDFEDEDFPDTPACRIVQAKSDALEARVNQKLAGEAQREYEVESSGFTIAKNVEIQISVYRDGKDLKAALAESDAISRSAEVIPCFEEAILDAFGSSLQSVVVRRASPHQNAPSGGATSVLEIEYQIPGAGQLDQRIETYTWIYGNAVAEVVLTGPPSEITRAFVSDVITKSDARLRQRR